MKKIIFLIALFIIPIVSAELEIIPSSLSGSVYVGTEKEINFSLWNKFTFPIEDISFTDEPYFTFPTIEKIEPNQTVNTSFKILSDTSFDTKTISTVASFYYKETVILDPVTHDINITDDGFTPYNLEIKIGDSIRFTNLGSFQAEVKDDAGKYFTRTVNVNETIVVPQGSDTPFNSPETNMVYRDLNDLTKTGILSVINHSDELIHNSDYDKVMTVSYNSVYQDSELGIEIYPDENITLEHNSFQELNIRIYNKGENEIHKVRLRANTKENWFTFGEQNFSLDSYQNRFIDLRITPVITKTDETGKNYTINIIAESENANSVSTELIIFIPYSSIIYSTNYSSDFWEKREEYCESHPEDLFCNPPPEIIKEEIIVYKNATLEYDKVEAMQNDREQNRRLTSIESNQEKQTKSINTMEATIKGFFDIILELNTSMAKSNELSEEAIKDSENTKVNFYLFIFLTILIACLGFSTYILYQKRKKYIEMGAI